MKGTFEGMTTEQIQEEAKRAAERWMISQHIACPEAGYPLSEARFATVEEWKQAQKERQDV